MPIGLKFKASLDDSAFMAGIRRIKTASAGIARGLGRANRATGFGASLATLGGGAVAAGALGVAGARAVMRQGDELYNLSRKTGMATQSLAALAEMAAGANIDLEEVAAASAKLSKNLATKEGKAAVEDLGLSFAEIKKLRPEEQFARIGAAIAAISDQSRKVTETNALFGKGGSSLFEMFDDISKLDMSRVSENAKTMGDAAKNIADANDKIQSAIFKAKSFGAGMLNDIIEGNFLERMKILAQGPAAIERNIAEQKQAAADAAAKAPRDPFAGFTTANKTPSLAFQHLRDSSQYFRAGVPTLRGGITNSNGVFQPTDMGAAYGAVRRGDARRRKALAIAMGDEGSLTTPGAWGRISRGDHARGLARQRSIEDAATKQVQQQRDAEETKKLVEKILGLLTDSLE